MNFLIADTFTHSLSRLTDDERKAVKTTAFDLQMNPVNLGQHSHRLDGARDKNFWSVRVNKDIRIIVHKTSESLVLCYVDHHDKAYAWAERRKLETHPKTGAAQFVEIRERVEEVVRKTYVEQKIEAPLRPKKKLFVGLYEDILLGYGVPKEWIKDVLNADEDSLLVLTDRLPAEASEALLELATGGTPRASAHLQAFASNPFEHPDAKRRFRVMSNVEELQRALEFPWDKWTIFLHPDQKDLVERKYSGPMRVAGSAGTGKTIVALHRAVFLARQNPEARVLLTTFSEILTNALRAKLHRLISNEPSLAERLEVYSIDDVGLKLYRTHFGSANVASQSQIHDAIRKAASSEVGHKFTQRFLVSEWEQVVDAWQLETWEAYRDVIRLGRKTRLPETQRTTLWKIFERVRKILAGQGLVTMSEVLTKAALAIAKNKRPPFEYAVIDECQDMCVGHIRLLAAIGGKREDALFFAGDLGQRIFQQPFSWLALGVDVRGRSKCLKVNYRTSHQIRSHADRLLENEVTDADGNVEKRGDTISAFNGVEPDVKILKTFEDEEESVSQWIKTHISEGMQPHEFGIFVRSENELSRAKSALQKSGLPFQLLDKEVETVTGKASVGTMHLAKGLEFRAVVVMACDDEIIPQQDRVETVSDEGDLKEVYQTERHLLYVACTRARDFLIVTGCAPGSEFLGDLNPISL